MALLAAVAARADDFAVSVSGYVSPGPYQLNTSYYGYLSATPQVSCQNPPTASWSLTACERQTAEGWVAASGVTLDCGANTYGYVYFGFTTPGTYRFTVAATVSVAGQGSGTGSATFTAEVPDPAQTVFGVSLGGGLPSGPYQTGVSYSSGLYAYPQISYQSQPQVTWSVPTCQREEQGTWVNASGAGVVDQGYGSGLLTLCFASAGSYRFTVRADVVVPNEGHGTATADYTLTVAEVTPTQFGVGFSGSPPSACTTGQTSTATLSAYPQTYYQNTPTAAWSVTACERQDGAGWVPTSGATVTSSGSCSATLSLCFGLAGAYRFTIRAGLIAPGEGSGTGTADYTVTVSDPTTTPPGGGGDPPPPPPTSSSLPGAIRVHVFDADNNNMPLAGKSVWLMSADGLYTVANGVNTDALGNADLPNIYAGSYRLQLQVGEEYGCAAGRTLTQSVTVVNEQTVVVEWPLSHLDPSLSAGVKALRDGAGNELSAEQPVGGELRPQVEIACTPSAFVLRRLWVWAWDQTANRVVWLCQGEQRNTSDATDMRYAADYLSCTYRLAVEWPTARDGHGDGVCTWPNGPYELMAAAEFSNPFGPPILKGTLPTDPADPGTPGGASLGVTLKNLTVQILGTSNGTQDWLRYDPDGAPALSRPSVTFRIDAWRDTPRTVVVYLIPTQLQGASPLQRQTGGAPTGVASFETTVGNGEHTITWDGSLFYGGEPDSAPWGTYAFDVYAYGGDSYDYGDWTSARLPYTLGVPATVQHEGQPVAGHRAWIAEQTDGSRDMRFAYQLSSTTNTPAANVQMTCLDGDLAERGTMAGATSLGTYHKGADGQGCVVAALTADDIEVPPWRVILTGEAGSGAECRRDRANPRMLAVNGLAGEKGVYQLWVHKAADAYDLWSKLSSVQWDYLDANINLLKPTAPGQIYERLNEPLVIFPNLVLGGHVRNGDLSSEQQSRASKYHVTTACVDNDPETPQCDDTNAGVSPYGHGKAKYPDRFFVNHRAVSQTSGTWFLPNVLLHEIGHTCSLGHAAPGRTVMPSSASDNSAMLDYLYPANADGPIENGPSAWGEGICQQSDGRWRVANEDTKQNIIAMRRHCGITATEPR